MDYLVKAVIDLACNSRVTNTMLKLLGVSTICMGVVTLAINKETERLQQRVDTLETRLDHILEPVYEEEEK